MKKEPTRQSMLVSTGVHCLLLAAFFLFRGQAATSSQPMVIDFSIEKTPALPRAENLPPVPRKVRHQQPEFPKAVDPREIFPDTTEPDISVRPEPPLEDSASLAAAQAAAYEDSISRLKTAYVAAQYGRIRDQVYQKLKYPETAVRNQWQGELKVAFWVHCDGRVDSIRILESSGIQLLDKNAIEAVRRAAPFPPSPKKVEIRLPVTYRLE